jgi:hypothetical protein
VLITDELNDLLDDEAAPDEHLVVDDVLQLVVHLCGALDDELPIFQVLEYRPRIVPSCLSFREMRFPALLIPVR